MIVQIRRKIAIMKRSHLSTVAPILALLLWCPVFADDPVSKQCNIQYSEALEKTFLRHFFAPRGGWDLSDAAATAILHRDGQLRAIQVTRPLKNNYTRHSSRGMDTAPVMEAISAAGPVSPPPSSIRCPAVLKIDFRVADHIHGGYRCIVQIVPATRSVDDFLSGRSNSLKGYDAVNRVQQ